MEEKSEKQIEAQRLTRNKELKAVNALDPGFSCQGLVGKFIGVYIQSEVFAKKLQHYYDKDTKKDTKKSGKNELQITILKAALKHFNLTISETDMSELFKGGEGKRRNKSARQLRNSYLHTLSIEDKKEIMEKADSFIPRLEKFISNEIPTV